jgi:transposase
LLEGYLYKKCILSSENQKIDQGGEPKIMKEIHNKAGIRYHEVPIYRLLHKCGFKPIVPKRDLSILDQKKRNDRSKK